MARSLLGRVAAWEGLDQNQFIRLTIRAQPRAGSDLMEVARSICGLFSSPQNDAAGSRTACLLSQPSGGLIELAIPAVLAPGAQGVTQLLNMLSLPVEYDHAESLVVETVQCPSPDLDQYVGPRVGVPAVRLMLKAADRPLLGVILKPRLMMNIDHHLESIRDLANVGMDFLVDDELMADVEGARFDDRLTKVLEALASGKTSSRCGYIVNVTARPSLAIEQAKAAKKAGAVGLVTNPIVTGFGALEDLALEGLGMPIVATNIGAALFAKGPSQGSFAGLSEATLAKLTRLAGADAVHLGIDKSDWYDAAPGPGAIGVLASPLRKVLPAFRVVAGGLDIVKLVDNWPYDGEDVIFEAGSAVFSHPAGPAAGLKAFKAAFSVAQDSAAATPALSRKRAKKRLLQLAESDRSVKFAIEASGWQPEPEELE